MNGSLRLIARHIAAIALWGPEPVEPALARCRAILDDASSHSRGLVQASCLMRIGGLQGSPAGSRRRARRSPEARAIMDDLGLHHQKAHSTDVAVLVEILAEDYEAAEREARHAYAVLTEMGDVTYQASEALLIAEALELQGRTDEAEEWLATSNEIDDTPDDPDALVVQARLLARRGRLDEAIELARVGLDRGAELLVPFADAASRSPSSSSCGTLRGGGPGCRGMPPTLRGEGHRPARPEGEGAARRDPGSRLGGERELRQDRRVARLAIRHAADDGELAAAIHEHPRVA